jgi:hypothetical protein
MEEKRALVDPKGWDRRMDQVLGGAGAGGGARTFLSAIEALGLTPDRDQSGGGTVGVERGTATRGSGLPGMGGLGQPIDTSSTDAIIDMYKKQLEELTKPSSSGNQFGGYRSNYLLETPFQTSAPALEETLRAMNEMSPTERSLLMDSLRQTGGRAEPAAQYRRDNFTGPQNGPLVAIADTGGDAYDWLQKSLGDALAKAGSLNEATAEQGQTDLWAVARGWGSLPPYMQAAFPGLGEAVASGKMDTVRRIQRAAGTAALNGGGPHAGQWLADQATLVSQIRDPDERAYRASKLYEIAQNVPREMGGDVAGTIVRVYEDARRAGNINLLDGGFRAIGTETQKRREQQRLDFTREVSENVGPIRSAEADALLDKLARTSREAEAELSAMRNGTYERELTASEGAEFGRRAAELESIIIESGAERNRILSETNSHPDFSFGSAVGKMDFEKPPANPAPANSEEPDFSFGSAVGKMDFEKPPVKPALVGPVVPSGAVIEQARNMRMTAPSVTRPGGDVTGFLAHRGGAMAIAPTISRIADELYTENYAKPPTTDRLVLLKTAADEAANLMKSKNREQKIGGAKLYGESISELYLSGVQPEDAIGASYFMDLYAKSLEDESVREDDLDVKRKKAAKALLVRKAAKEVLAPPTAAFPAPPLSFEPTDPSAADESSL